MKNKKPLFGVLAIGILIVCYFAYQRIMYVKTDNAQVEAPTLLLAPKVSGFVRQVNVSEGQKVKKDDVLAEIDDRDFQNSLVEKQAALESARAKFRETEKNYRRISELYKKEAVSQQQHDQTMALYSEQKAQTDAIAAQVAQTNLNLENTKIKAPFDGFVARKSVEVGQLAAPGTPLFGFVGTQERWVLANFKETDLGALHIGAKVDVEVDAISSRHFSGTVAAIAAATGATFTLLPPDNATGNFTKVVQRVPVRINLTGLNENDLDLLRAGLSAEVKVHKR